ncbi:Response regulator protein VraR [compost metagenome]
MKNGDHYEYCIKGYRRLNNFLIQRMGPALQNFSDRYQFTQRESEILVLIAVFGFSNREIAEQCVITEKTVKNHVANMMKKIGIRSTRKLLSMLFNHVLYFENIEEGQINLFFNHKR